MDPASYVMQMAGYGAPMMTPEGMMHMAGMVPMPGGPLQPGALPPMAQAMQMPPVMAMRSPLAPMPRFDNQLPLQSMVRAPSSALSSGVDSTVSTAPQTPKAAARSSAGPELELATDSNPEVITIRPGEARLIKVPDFVADTWSAQKPGTVLGVLTAKSSNPRRVGIHFPRNLNLPVTKIQPNNKKAGGAGDSRESSEVVLSAVGAGYKRSWPINANARIEGHVTDQCAYLPDISDPSYRAYLENRSSAKSTLKDDVQKTPIVLSAEESAKLHQKLVEDVSEATTSKRLFHYYGQGGDKDGGSNHGGGSEDDDLDSNVGSSVAEGGGGGHMSRFRGNNKKRKPTHLSTEEGQAKLFRFFESKGNQPASMKEIVCFLGATQTFTKQLLDQIAEPVRERQGKRVSFVLKAEYRGNA